MAINRNEAMVLGALAVGLLVLKDRNYDVTMNGVKDDNDKGVIIFLGALVALWLLK